MSSNETLTKFGKTFQSQVLAAFFKDVKFFEQVFDLLDKKYFDSEASQWITIILMEHYKEFKVIPSLPVMKVKITEIENDILKTVVTEKLREVFTHINSPDLEFVKQKFLEFCKNKKFEQAITDSLDFLEAGNYDRIREAFDEALKAGTSRDIGHDYIEKLEERLTKAVRKTVATGWKVVDELMDGGLAPKELGVVVAPPGVGKSWALVAIAANAVKRGLFVVYYTLELSEDYVGLRFDSNLTSMTIHELRKQHEVVKKMVAGLSGRLLIKEYPTKSITVNGLMSHINRLQMLDKKPDLIVVDYGDILISPTKYSDIRHLELGSIYEELRRMAGETQIPVWTASQANRESMSLDVITATSIAESFNKIMIADFIISVSRKESDKVHNRARWHIIKNRFGADGLTFLSNMDTTMGYIEINDVPMHLMKGKKVSDTSSTSSASPKEKKEAEDVVKSKLAKIYETTMNA